MLWAESITESIARPGNDTVREIEVRSWIEHLVLPRKRA